ncbi:MAG: flippase-like domain-containing protein [Acholeplasmatales bacterium]|nr:flippase-like domain-containing protein [Acholeplasmatales bacterium]
MYSKKKIIQNLILVGGIIVILVILIVSLGDIKSIWHTITTQANFLWMLATLGLVLAYCFFNSLSIVFLTRRKYKDISRTTLFYVAGSEFFFNAITPFSSGGQPFQAYALKQKGVKFSDSTSILLLNFLAYQIVMNIISVAAVIWYYGKLSNDVPNLSWLVFIGFTINLLVMIVLVLLGTTKFMGKGILKLIDLFAKIKFLKKFLESRREGFQVYVSEMQSAFKEMGSSKRVWCFAAISKAIALMIFYCIPFFSFLSIGINLGMDNFIYVAAMTSFALTIAIWIPTPGSSGGAEFAFTTLFVGLSVLNGAPLNPEASKDVAKNLAMSGMLIWRLFTYYLLMLYGLLMYVLFTRTNKDSQTLEPTTEEEKQELAENTADLEENKEEIINTSSEEN